MKSLSVRDVKRILQIDETEHDDYIEEMLPLAIEFVESYCNDVFSVKDDNGIIVKDKEGYLITEAGIIISIAKIIEFFMRDNGVIQEMVGRSMATYATALPNSITANLNSFRKVKFV